MKLNFPAGMSKFIDSAGAEFRAIEGFVEVEAHKLAEFLKAGFTHAEPLPPVDHTITKIDVAGVQTVPKHDQDPAAEEVKPAETVVELQAPDAQAPDAQAPETKQEGGSDDNADK